MRGALALLLLALLAACGEDGDRAAGRADREGRTEGGSLPAERPDDRGPVLRFRDVTEEVGLSFVHDNGRSERKHLPETMAGGGAVLDANGDGLPDLYLVQSGPVPGGGGEPRRAPGNELFLQRADGTFEPAGEESGAADRGFGMGAYAADADGDGATDLFVTNDGPNRLFLGDGRGRFADATERAGLSDERWSSAAAWFDADGDGDLDLYVANYLRYDPAAAPRCFVPGTSIPSYCSPKLFEGEDDVLYENLGDGRFRDVSAAAGILGPRGKGLGVTVFDLGADGDFDLVVANDTTPTLLFENLGGLRFEECGLRRGVAYSEDGVARAGMGIDVGDLDGDGLDDLFVTNFAAEDNAVFLQRPGGVFREASRPSGIGAVSFPFLGFGCVLEDFDLDGDLDVCVANGHVLDTAELSNRATSYRQRPLLFVNDGRGRFREVGASAGAMFRRRFAGRGLLSLDLDLDGDRDLVLLQVGDSARVWRNETEGKRRRLAVRLVGRGAGRDALGAAVEVRAGGFAVRRTLRPARSYLSSPGRTLCFGVPQGAGPIEVLVAWPSGGEERVEVEADRLIVIEEGRGVVEARPLGR